MMQEQLLLLAKLQLVLCSQKPQNNKNLFRQLGVGYLVFSQKGLLKDVKRVNDSAPRKSKCYYHGATPWHSQITPAKHSSMPPIWSSEWILPSATGNCTTGALLRTTIECLGWYLKIAWVVLVLERLTRPPKANCFGSNLRRTHGSHSAFDCAAEEFGLGCHDH